MDPQQAAQLLKAAPSPTGQLSKWQQFLTQMFPGFADTAQNFTTDPMGVMQRNVARALPTQAEQDYTMQTKGDIASSAKNKLMAMILQTVYHGSPANFDKFDMSKVGTGEGAQAYGHGMYFAENPNVGDMYRKAVSGFRSDYTGDILPELKSALQKEDFLGFDNAAQALKAIRSHADWATRWDVQNPQAIAKAVQAQEKLAYSGQGHLYSVDLPDEQIAKMLHWDKPLSDQPAIKKILDSFRDKPFPDNWTGGQAYQSLARNPAIADQASEHLLNNGVPGIKYLDQGSRGAGAGTHNYVVFDPSNLKILGKE